MPAKPQERVAVQHLVEAIRAAGTRLEIASEGGNDFPDFILTAGTGEEQWVEVVEAVESGAIRAAESRAERNYRKAKEEFVDRGEEVILHVSEHGVEKVVPAPGYGVTGILLSAGPRRVWPEDWIDAALAGKAAPERYSPEARSRTWLVIDCSKEILLEPENVEAARTALDHNTLGFAKVWCVSSNWSGAKALLLAP